MSDDQPGSRTKTRVTLDRQTTHRDVDMLPEPELGRLQRAGSRDRWRRHASNAGLVAAVLAMAGAVTAVVS